MWKYVYRESHKTLHSIRLIYQFYKLLLFFATVEGLLNLLGIQHVTLTSLCDADELCKDGLISEYRHRWPGTYVCVCVCVCACVFVCV